jgi:hypothetical protein
MCSACYHAFVSASSKVEAGHKLRKERQIRIYRHTRHRMTWILSLLWPGLGHLYGGAPLRGLVAGLFTGLLWAWLGISLDILPAAHLPGLPVRTWPVMGCAFFLLLVYGFTVRSAVKLEE